MSAVIRPYLPQDGERLYERFAPGSLDLETWQRSFRGKTALVVEEDGVLLGFGVLDISVVCSVCAAGRLERLFVAEEVRRQGLGRRLLTALEEDGIRNCAGVITVLAPEAAVPFFEVMGYSRLREIAEEDGFSLKQIVMEKRL